MTEAELQDLATSLAELKKAIRRNNPILRQMLSSPGWLPLTLMAGIGLALFCLPAQILQAAYGSFEAIPPVYRTILWCLLAVVVVVSAVWKMVLIAHKAAEVEKDAGILTVLRVLFTGQGFHIGGPYFLTVAVLSAFAVSTGHPWYIVPAVVTPTCFWANTMATMTDSPAFAACGWWCLVSGLASLFFIEAAPFIWLFITLGGCCLLFAALVIMEAARARTRGR